MHPEQPNIAILASVNYHKAEKPVKAVQAPQLLGDPALSLSRLDISRQGLQ